MSAAGTIEPPPVARAEPTRKRPPTVRTPLPWQGKVFWLIFAFWMLPILWMIGMSVRPNSDIVGSFSYLPTNVTFDNYIKFFTDPTWYGSYTNSIIYASLNTVLSVSVALPAAYAFSRFSFAGDKHLFFWLLTNRMAPAAVFLLPFFQLYQTVGLFDTHIGVAIAHMLFNVPLAVWILEGFMSGVPRELDETAAIDGYRLPRFFFKVFFPMIRSGIGVTAFFCFTFSWVELLIARTITSVNARPIAVQMTSTISASGVDWGLLAAAGTMATIPGLFVIFFVRKHIATGFALGRV